MYSFYEMIPILAIWGALYALTYYVCRDIVEEEMEEEKKKKEEEEERKPVPYEEKYSEKYALITEDNCDISNLKNNSVFENTPLGNVLMFYDANRKSFVYYSDNNIPYRYLETVGRKYVVTYKCPSIFYDMKKEIALAEDKTRENREKEKEKEKENVKDKEEKSVFAKFKKYNTPTDGKKSTKQPVDETLVVKENANRYSREGKFANFAFLKKPQKQMELSYADFKKKYTGNV